MFSHRMFNHTLSGTERVVEEHMRNVVREADQTGPVQGADGPVKVEGWAQPVALMLSALLSLVVRLKS